MMVKKRGLKDEKEREEIRKESGGRQESCCTSPAEEAECWTSWMGLLITQTHSLTQDGGPVWMFSTLARSDTVPEE